MTQSTAFTIAPGGWLGLLGGGQLGRMFCHAAQSLGYKVAVLDPAAECPAGMVADLHIQAAYDDDAGLARLAQTCQAVTTEFENVPAASLRASSVCMNALKAYLASAEGIKAASAAQRRA